MKTCFLLMLLYVIPLQLIAQNSVLKSLAIVHEDGCTVQGFALSNDKAVKLPASVPFFSLLIDGIQFDTKNALSSVRKLEFSFLLADSIKVKVKQEKEFKPGIKYTIRFENGGKTNHKIENLVPFGEGTDRVFITAGGTKEWPHYLCRSLLFRPGYGPVGVILPDNAWHLGFTDIQTVEGVSVTGLTRRKDRDKLKSEIDRWATTLKPGGWVEYHYYVDIHDGDWHTGLNMMFQERWLYDLQQFNDSLFNRSDLSWMKHEYLMLLQFAWDKKFYDAKAKRYTFYDRFFEFDSLTGGYDIFTLWPTWPRLGLDQRNQWDMYRDLPGGLGELKRQSDFLHKRGKRYFISYNPWDESTRKEDQFKGMEALLRATDADGVVLDTRGASSFELQATADKVKPGIIMYSEGMAVPKDMPGIVSGRVHDALVLPPPLNLNKLIKPDFAIFRVLQLADDRLHRELAISFFNGYGVEINTMRPGRPEWMREEFAYMGRTTKLLRENTSVFHNYQWVPLIPTLVDSVYVNEWSNGKKTLYTIYSNKPAGHSGVLFKAKNPGLGTTHFVDLWNHVEVELVNKDDGNWIPLKIDPFDRAFVGTRREGNVGCVAELPALLEAKISGDYLEFAATAGDKIVITRGNPAYNRKQFVFSAFGNSIPYQDYFDVTNKKIVIQLFEKDELLDERVLDIQNDIPFLISTKVSTKPVAKTPDRMVAIPEGDYRFYTLRAPNSADPFITLPDHSDTVTIHMKKFYMDQYLVSNYDYKVFIKKTQYLPRDTNNYLRHWKGGNIPEGEEDHPVVYVNLDDAKAYASWANKRLPTETEWQYAAQGTDMRKYPWGNELDSTKCNFTRNRSTKVSAFPKGASPFGVEDMVGNVWQLTNDIYDVGSYYYTIIKGGSYYQPTSSIWYVTGGPLPAYHPQMLLLLSPGLDRNATVGFRCVRDAQ